MRGQYFREISLGCVFLGLLVFLGIFAPAFFELQPLLSRLSAQTPAMVVVVGMVMVMICRQIDISVGSDAEAARLAGIDPGRTTMGVFVVLGGLTGLAAVMNVVQSPQVDPLAGSGLEMKVIAAAVVGGVAVSGGRGRLWGVFVGLLLLATVNPALTYLRVESYWEKAIQGMVLIVAVVADRFRRPPKFSA